MLAVGTKNIVEVLRERGLIEQVTSEELEKISTEKKLKVYCGFDPTADALHLGNLMGILVLVWCGHTPVALLGGATALVGDPSGKSAERPILSEEAIQHNKGGIRAILEKLLSNGEVEVMDNLDWYGDMPLLTFLRDVGKNARVGVMTAKESVKKRLDSESGMSFTEFTYQLLQGYDFCYMYDKFGVNVQIGGSDQWGNITAGTDLIRRILQKDGAHGLTFPLLLRSDGQKFGKSEDGAIWLTADKLSPYKFYQYLFSVPDADVCRLLRSLTFLPIEDIVALEAEMKTESYEANTAQRLLASEVTRFVHGQEGLDQALRATESMKPGSDTELSVEALEAIADDVPSILLPKAEVVGAMVAAMMVSAGLCKSKSEARKLIKGGGCRLNNEKVQEELAEVVEGDLVQGKLLLLAAGKKKKALVRITQ
eukprot:scaffold3697_cov390-Prasinococcus_capsulatus_cf.AAC.4